MGVLEFLCSGPIDLGFPETIGLTNYPGLVGAGRWQEGCNTAVTLLRRAIEALETRDRRVGSLSCPEGPCLVRLGLIAFSFNFVSSGCLFPLQKELLPQLG